MCKGVIMMQILSFIDKICQNRGAGSATGKPNFQFLQDMLDRSRHGKSCKHASVACGQFLRKLRIFF